MKLLHAELGRELELELELGRELEPEEPLGPPWVSRCCPQVSFRCPPFVSHNHPPEPEEPLGPRTFQLELGPEREEVTTIGLR